MRNYICPDCGNVVGEGSTSCLICNCNMNQIVAGKKSNLKLPYTEWAGRNDLKSVPKDKFGNPNGSTYDLLFDKSMKGYSILIVNLCRDSQCNRKGYNGPITALENKGFTVDYYDAFPSNFAQILDRYCQFWLISGYTKTIDAQQTAAIINFYNQGKGVYLWADNDPFYADINPIISEMFSSSMSGAYLGDKVVSVQKNPHDYGIVAGHLISTGIMNFYEGITISQVKMTQHLKPLIYSSDKNVVTAYSDRDNKRILIDGGFTRLFFKWDSAGTDRYVVNAAGWLGNFERFGWEIPGRRR